VDFEPDAVVIPLRNRSGEVVATTIVDAADQDLAELRWHLGASGYAIRGIRPDGPGTPQRAQSLARAVLGDEALQGGKWADHVDRNKLDNRKRNLRAVSPAENARNRSPYNELGLRGVERTRERYRGRVMFEGRRIHLGTYDTEREAADAVEAFWQRHNN
jgi:hypothetical protein